MIPTLIDSNFLFELLLVRSPKRERLRRALIDAKAQILIPYIVLTEVAFLFNRVDGKQSVSKFMRDVSIGNREMIPTVPEDLRRGAEILDQYHDSKFEFVDVCMMAMAERLNITQIATLDIRDFTAYRPRHVEYFTLVGTNAK